MKTHSSHPCSVRSGFHLSVWAGVLALTAGAAVAGLEDKFNAADIDNSGTLTIDEFKTTLPGKPPAKLVEKKFDRADTDTSGDLTLDEFLAAKKGKKGKWKKKQRLTNAFEKADLDDDGYLTYEEFQPLIKGKRPLINVRLRFLRTDADDDELVSLQEWLDSKLKKLPKEPTKPTKFDLADLDGNDELTLEEFAAVFPPKVKERVIARKFDRKDKNEDDVLTRNEWNPGGGKKN